MCQDERVVQTRKPSGGLRTLTTAAAAAALQHQIISSAMQMHHPRNAPAEPKDVGVVCTSSS